VLFRGQNGKLVIVVDAVRLTPRLWDGQRFLRFLAGLAMLALAFAAHAGLIGPTALPPTAGEVATVSAPATVETVPVTTTADETSAVPAGDELGVPATSGVVGLALLTIGSIVVAARPLGGVRLGELSGVGTRGPPLR
jgi:hypothetical protein